MPLPHPDFVIVGAPRAGTTSLYNYLRAHPEVFMPANKEPHYFGSDLAHQHAALSWTEYQALFRRAKPGQRTGEASPLYLMSHRAADEIREVRPDARIIVMLRQPVDLIYSLYLQNVSTGVDDAPTFQEALERESARSDGKALAPRTRATDALRYREVARLGDQLARVRSAFPPEQIHIIRFDDLRSDESGAFADVARFLGVQPRFRAPKINRNTAQAPRSWRLQHWLTHPTAPFDRLATRLRRLESAHALRGWLLDMNRRPAVREPLDRSLRRELIQELEPQVRQIEEITGLDLSGWRLRN